ncbi:hypothetical protein PROFUN_10836, partial [Planoprotostelium fungivorum]
DVASQYDYTFLPDTWFSNDLNNTLQLWIQNSFTADDSVPDTKHRVHEFITFKLKLAKSQQGLKNKRYLKNPDLKDNLCFWRCITIALYESSCQGIQQANKLVRPLFLAYDFECILKKIKNNEVKQKATYTHSHEPIGVVMLAGGCLADQARDLEYEYCGPDAGLLKTYFWKHHNKQMAVIESQKCSCQYTLQHRPWCKETTPTDQPCRCGHCRQHKKGCKYIVTKCLIMKEYLSIPILGFNSGKYDLTFIITHMQKYDVSPPITKTNSYMKLEYGAYAFLDAHNYVPYKLSETSLLPIECFCNKLKNTLPSEAEYGHAGTANYRSLLMTKNNMELLNYVSVAQISYQNILKKLSKA